MPEILTSIQDLVEICLFPTLERSVDDRQISDEDYKEFKSNCEKLLPLLFDQISKGIEANLFLDEDEDLKESVLDLKVLLLRLICEQTFDIQFIDHPFQIETPEFKTVLSGFQEKIYTADQDFILERALKAYEGLLIKDKWKKEVGSCYGFVKFSELFLTKSNKFRKSEKIYFFLSIGSQFLENFSPEFKALGAKLFQIVLNGFDKNLILDLNIHKVIFKDCLQNSQKLLNENCQFLLWDCLFKSLAIDEILLMSLQWNELDDCLQILFQKMKMESKIPVKDHLKNILIKFIQSTSPLKSLENEELDSVRDQILTTDSRNIVFFRWIKNLCDLFVFECLSISSSAENLINSIQFIHLSYLLVIFGTKLQLVSAQLDDLIKRLMPLFMEILNVHQNKTIEKVILAFLTTMVIHIESYSTTDEKTTLQKALIEFVINKASSSTKFKVTCVKMKS